ANLSNDEVFTPPEFANRMLDTLAEAWAASNGGTNIWSDSTVTFLDPCTKSGVFLREITKRLIAGLSDEIPDLQTRVDHILTRQVFGIGITTLTSLLARRSLYCSKHADGEHSVARSFARDEGNIWFERTEHTWVDRKCKFCNATQRDYDRGESLETHAYAFIHTKDIRARMAELFGGEMQFDVIIGNPPYQLGQSGGEAIGGFAMPIYQKFVQAAKGLDPHFVIMVTPSRWFAGGRGLDEYRAEMLADKRVRQLIDFPDASEAFPGTQIKGGVSYFLWDNAWNGPCEVTTVHGGDTAAPSARNLDAYDVLVRRNEAVPILEKVLKANTKDGFGNLASKVSPIQPFSIRTNFRGAAQAAGLKNPVRLIGNGGDTFIEREDVPRNDAWVDKWKVLLGAAYGAGENLPHQIFNYPIIAGPGTACTETYLVIDKFSSEKEALRFTGYLRTRLVRFLVSLRKYTQHLYNERFQFVPDLPMDREWTDALLYKKYGITEDEISFIDSMIRPMDRSGE
ncbi:MAG: Eco57I restriction-modification methylase domain-containing protein, partial [Rhizobiaceae bacterium]|nr:Eco57I restriction-modification methylase domain-containing protein [Rhizobiaceae bacterium]